MMTMVRYEGYEIRVFSSMYMDYGLEISREGETLYYNPCCLSCESYGFHYSDDWEDGHDGLEWSEQDWKDRLIEEAGELVDCFVPLMDQEG